MLYSPYFHKLNLFLRQHGHGSAMMLLDIDRFNRNIQTLVTLAPANKQCRIVVKSLACLPLLEHIQANYPKQLSWMVFQPEHLLPLHQHFPDHDILLGKPFTIQAMQHLFARLTEPQSLAKLLSKTQWLVDSKKRLIRFLSLAQHHQVMLRINLEVNVGLHRGGLNTEQELIDVLTLIHQHPQNLTLSGLMGYDAHVAKIPKIIASRQQLFEQSQKLYTRFVDVLISQGYRTEALCLNSAGSSTFCLHTSTSIANDLSIGSALVLPSDFDHFELTELFQPALFIATPILKKVNSVKLPSMAWLNILRERLLPKQALFLHGGSYLARPASPKGMAKDPLFGKSTNQQLYVIDASDEIDDEDYVFLRPTQSEVVLAQFGAISLIHGDATQSQSLMTWQTLSL